MAHDITIYVMYTVPDALSIRYPRKKIVSIRGISKFSSVLPSIFEKFWKIVSIGQNLNLYVATNIRTIIISYIKW